MVFAIAALLIQFHPAPQVLAPIFTAELPSKVAAASGNGSTGTSSVKTIAAESGTGHIDVNSVSLRSDSGEKPTPAPTALALPNDQNSQSFSTVRIPEPSSLKPEKVYSAETPRMSKSWLALSLIQHGAATFDAYSTRQAIGHGAVEDNPLMRPFAHSGAIYAAIQVGPLVLDYVARRMQHSEYGMVRRMWFIPQSVSTAGFILSGVHNLGVESRQ